LCTEINKEQTIQTQNTQLLLPTAAAREELSCIQPYILSRKSDTVE